MGVGGADAAAPGLLVGFLDQFLPAVMAGDIDFELTKFVLAGLSVCQLIYMSEVGILLLRSILPLTFLDLVLIFLQRTIILVPVLVIAGKLIIS
jgi:nucleoside recognition membrane protein YjiH